MAAGLLTDAQPRVLRADGEPVPGLHAGGNDRQSVMNGAYPGPGITPGPAWVFGWTAAQAANGHWPARLPLSPGRQVERVGPDCR